MAVAIMSPVNTSAIKLTAKPTKAPVNETRIIILNGVDNFMKLDF
jgi:hypothetical protein